MKFNLKSVVKFILFIGVGLLIFYFLYRNFEASYLKECEIKGIPESECSLIDKLITDFKSVKIFWLIIIVVIYMTSNVFRALRWNQLLEPLGYKPKLFNSLGATMLAYFANLAFPRLGELMRPGTLTKYEDVPFEQAVGTVVLDRILDFLALFVVTGIALILSFGTFKDYFTQHFKAPSNTTIYLLIGLGILGLIGLFIFNKLLQNSNSKNPFINKVRSLWIGFKEGLSSLKNVKNKPLLVAYTIGIWVMYYLMTYLCFFAFAPTENLGAIAGLVVFVFGTLGMVFPSPGGMGSYHFLISQALILYGINPTDAFSFSNIVFFTITIFGNIIFGLFFLIALPIYNKK